MSVRLVPSLPDDPEMWKCLMNHIFICEEDDLFQWLRSVRAAVEEHERRREERAA